MSVKTDQINVQINVNSNQALNELNELRKKANDIRAGMVGLKKSTQEYADKKAELAKVTAEMDALKKTIGITALNQRELERELSKLQRLKGSAVPFSNEYKEWAKQIAAVQDRLYEVRNNVTGFSKVFSKISDSVKQFGVVAAGYLGFQFITEQFKNILTGAAKMSDQLADLRRVAGLTAEEAKNLNKSLSGLDTRTSMGALRDIAVIAGKLGVAKNDLVGFTEAVDKLVVSLGDELGDADAVTTQLGKILNVFDGEVNGDNITKLGNSFVVMANAGVATGGFIADFAQRVAAVSKAANLGLGDVVGFAAGMEEMGLKSESASTAFQKVLGTIANDIPKAARLAGAKTKEEIAAFTNLFNNSPEQALIKFAEGLTKNKAGFAEMTASMKDAGEEGIRVITMLSTLGQNGDFFRGKIDQANESLQESTAITDAFSLKNDNLAASIDKLGKEFNRFMNSEGIKNFLVSAVEGTRKFIELLKGLPKFFSDNKAGIIILTLAYIAWNAEQIKARILALWNTQVLTGQTAAVKLLAAAKYLLTGNITKAKEAWSAFTAVLNKNPLGVLLTVCGLLAIAITTLTGKVKTLTAEQRVAQDVQRKAADLYKDDVTRVERLKKIITDEASSLQQKKNAYQDLIKIHPEFEKTLKLDEQGHLDGINAIDSYINALKRKSIAEARESVAGEKRRDIVKTSQTVAKEFAEYSGATSGGSAATYYSSIMAQKELDPKNELIGQAREVVRKRAAEIKAEWQNVLASNPEKITEIIDNIEKKIGGSVKSGSTAFKKQISELKILRADLKVLDDQTEAELRAELNKKRNPETTTDDTDKSLSEEEKKRMEKERKEREAQQKKEYDALLREARKFREELDRLKRKSDNGELSDRERELEQVTQQYNDLRERAKKYWLETTADGKRALSDIEQIRDRQIAALMKKFFAEDSKKEYQESLKISDDYFDALKRQAGRSYAEGKISKEQYENELKDIEQRATSNRVIIAEDYSAMVKQAAEDVTQFKNKQEEKQTADAISESEKRKAASMAEKLAALRLNVLTAPNGSKKELEAKKKLLNEQFKYDTEYLDKKSSVYLEKEEILNKELEELSKAHFERTVGIVLESINYFQQALSQINSLIANRENKELQREKKLNDAKRAEFDRQLKGKLISQERHDKKMASLAQQEEKREKEVKLRQAKRERALNIFGIIANTAAAIMETYKKFGFPVGVPFALAQGAIGALQIAAVSSAPLPELGRGGYLERGPKHRDSEKGLHVVDPLTGKTELLLEREEAVVNAKAMTSSKKMTVSGTAKQIASAINSSYGGVSFAPGAFVKWHNTPVPRFSKDLVTLMARGGVIGQQTYISNSTTTAADYSDLFTQLLMHQQLLQDKIDSWPKSIKAHVVYQEYKDKENIMERARNTGRISKL